MLTTYIDYQEQRYQIDLTQGIDISLALKADASAPSAWYCPPVEIAPVMTEQFTGAVALGGAVNFNNIHFNPHGNGTHTECVGHIAQEVYSINQCLTRFFFLAQLVSITPQQQGEDAVVSLAQIQTAFDNSLKTEAFILRTLPNSTDKLQRQYSNSNPPFVEATALNWLYEQGIRHFLIDTPSVDRELDEGVLAAHHAYWNYPDAPRFDATITELIYVSNKVVDGVYWLNLQVAALENDASPSRPVLYPTQSV